MLFTESQEGDFTRFIKWITASVTAHSRSVGDDKQPELSQTEYIVRLAKDEPVKKRTTKTALRLPAVAARPVVRI